MPKEKLCVLLGGAGNQDGAAMNDRDWVQSARGGDEEAFARLVRRHSGGLHRAVARILADDAEALRDYGAKIAAGGAALIPPLRLGYLDRPGHANPWDEPVAAILDPRDIHWPADRETGEHDYTADEAAAYRELAQARTT